MSNYITIRMFSDWGHNSSDLKNLLSRQTPAMINNVYKNLKFIDSGDADFSIVFNYAFDEISTDPDHSIGLILEPVEILDSMYSGWQSIDTSSVGSYYSFTPIEGYGKAFGVGFATAPSRKVFTSSDRKKACMIVSDKTYTRFQRKRRDVYDGLRNSDIDVDFYGRNMPLCSDHRVKGEIPPYEKHLILSNYNFVIDFENDPYAVTDKFFDPVICGSTPITNNKHISEYDDLSGFHTVDFDESVNEIISRIRSILDTEPSDVSNLRYEVLNGRLSIAEWIWKKVNKVESFNPW